MVTQLRIISSEESTSIYGFKKPREIYIRGTSPEVELTDEKVNILIKAMLEFSNVQYAKANEAQVAFTKFKKLCDTEKATVTFKS